MRETNVYLNTEFIIPDQIERIWPEDTRELESLREEVYYNEIKQRLSGFTPGPTVIETSMFISTVKGCR